MINISSIPEMKDAVEFTKKGNYALAVTEISFQFEKRIKENFSALKSKMLHEKAGKYFFDLYMDLSENPIEKDSNELLKACIYQAKKHYELSGTPASTANLAQLKKIFG